MSETPAEWLEARYDAIQELRAALGRAAHQWARAVSDAEAHELEAHCEHIRDKLIEMGDQR